MIFTKKLLFPLILALLVLICACQAEPAPTASASPCTQHTDTDDNGLCDDCKISVIVVIDFYNVNDLHGKIADGTNHPGVDELTTYLKKMRQSDDHVILLSSGDMWQGTPESNLTQGNLITDWMNEMDFAAMALGNHEFDWGEDPIAGNAAMAEFPMLAINVFDRDTGERVSYCDSSVMVEAGGIQIGIIGAIGDCYSSIAPDHTKGIFFKTGDQLTALVKAESEKLRAQGADLIVYMLHDGLGRSTSGTVSANQMASYYDIDLSDGYVDLVFEGHTHQSYYAKDIYGVYHLQGGGDNKGITHAEISVNTANGNVATRQADVISTGVYAGLSDDPLIPQLLEKYAEQIAPSNKVLGTVSRSLNRDEARQLIAQLYYEAGLAKWGDEYDIVLGGGFLSIRSPGYLPAGQVTYGTLQSIFPFDNELVLCSIKGSDLKSKFFESSNDSYFISYGAYGEEVRKNIDPNATYYIIVDSYTSTYAPNRLTEIQRYGAPVYARDLLAQYIQAGGLS